MFSSVARAGDRFSIPVEQTGVHEICFTAQENYNNPALTRRVWLELIPLDLVSGDDRTGAGQAILKGTEEIQLD